MTKCLPAVNPSPDERQIIRDAIATQLDGGDCHVRNIGPYVICISRLDDDLSSLSIHEIINLPSFYIVFEPDGVKVQVVRATSSRDLAVLDYADPTLVEQLTTVLNELGIVLIM